MRLRLGGGLLHGHEHRTGSGRFSITTRALRPVHAENLDSAILVMKAAENRSRCYGAEPLNRPMNGSVLAQSSMSPRFIVIGDKLAKDPAQMGLAEHNQVVETFPSDRANQSLRIPILPHRG